MRVRILTHVMSARGTFGPGEIVDVPKKIAQKWIEAGLAMEDKSLDRVSETKAESDLYWCEDCGCSHELNSLEGIKHRKIKVEA